MELLPPELRARFSCNPFIMSINYTNYVNLVFNLWYCSTEIMKDEEERYELFVSLVDLNLL